MGKYIVEIEPNARKELKAHFKSCNKATISKIEKILLKLTKSPYEGIGKLEPLKYELLGYWS